MPSFVMVLQHPASQSQLSPSVFDGQDMVLECTIFIDRTVAWVPDPNNAMAMTEVVSGAGHPLEATLPRGTFMARFGSAAAAHAWYDAIKPQLDLAAVYVFDVPD